MLKNLAWAALGVAFTVAFFVLLQVSTADAPTNTKYTPGYQPEYSPCRTIATVTVTP